MYVALGDSFTAGVEPGQPRWPDELARQLGGHYVNLAEVGATSEHVEQDQLERALELEPDVVTLVCGANDVLFSTRPDPDAYAARLSRMFARLRRELPHAQIVTATYPEIGRFLAMRPRTRARVEEGIGALQRRGSQGGAPTRRGPDGELRPPGGQRPRDLRGRRLPPLGRGTPPGGARVHARDSKALPAHPSRGVSHAAVAHPEARDAAPTNGGIEEGPDLFVRPFGEISVGDRFSTPARAIAEADILAFAALTGDRHPQHMRPRNGPPTAASASRSRTACSSCRSPWDCSRSIRIGSWPCAGWTTRCSSDL